LAHSPSHPHSHSATASSSSSPPASSCIHLSCSSKLDQDEQAIEVQGAADAGRPAPRLPPRCLPAPGRRRSFRVLRGQVRGAVRAVAREAGGVHEVLRAVLRGVRLRADGEERQPRRVPLLPRHAHRRAQEEAQVPLTALSSRPPTVSLKAPTASSTSTPPCRQE
uniref:Uncharacterized protein n=1 Tax=Triticum urartu TaxID=4572 RepID=A0A8R7Q076_TRIUA